MADIMSHGGDGSNQDPDRGGRRLPPRCELAPPPKRRGKSRMLNVEKRFRDNGSVPLPIDFDLDIERTIRPIGPNEPEFIRFLGTTVRQFIVPKYTAWSKVPEHLKDRVRVKVEKYFNTKGNIPQEKSPWVDKGIDKSASERYKEYKGKAHKHYKIHGRTKPFEDIDIVEWGNCADLFESASFKAASQRNAANRATIPYQSLQGSKSIVATRHANRDHETQKWPSILDTWKSVHTRQTNQGEFWVSEQAERQHYEMLQMKEKQTQQASLSGTQFDEHNVVREVLGNRRGHVRGVGRTIPGVSRSASSTATSPATGELARVAELEQRMEIQSAEMAEIKSELAETKSELARVNAVLAQILEKISGSAMTTACGVGFSTQVDGDDDDIEYYENDDEDNDGDDDLDS